MTTRRSEALRTTQRKATVELWGYYLRATEREYTWLEQESWRLKMTPEELLLRLVREAMER